MNKRIIFFAAALGLLGASHANAQERPNTYVPIQRDHRASTPVVHDFQPRTGTAGALVTIHGAGFTPAVDLRMGGRRVPMLAVRPHAITFRVPSHCGDGRIELTHPDVRRAIPVGDFRMMERLQVSHFTPRSGAPGDRIEIHGRGFRPGDRVFVDGRALTIHSLAPTRIVATIPTHATTGYLTIRGADDLVERSGQVFRVHATPEVNEVWPQQGYSGSQIAIRGSGFSPSAQVFVGNHRAIVVRSSEHEIVIQVPERVRHGRHLVRVRDGRAQAYASVKVLIREPLLLTSFSPGPIEAGQAVVLHGNGFGSDVRVFWGRHELPVRRVDHSGERLSVTIPAHLHGRRHLTVDDGIRRIQARDALVVVPARPARGKIEVRDHRDDSYEQRRDHRDRRNYRDHRGYR